MNLPQTQPTEKREHLDTLSAGAILPFMQATLLALVVFIVVWLVCEVTFNIMDAHRPAIFFAALAWLWMLWKLFRHWLSRTAVYVTAVARDLADDGRLNNSVQQAPVKDEPRVVNIRLDKVTSDNHYQSDLINFPCDDEQLYQLAFGLTNDPPLTFAERYWTGAGKPFSTNEFRAVVSVMEKHGLCEYVNAQEPKQGRRLTESGRKLLQGIALPHSPTSEDGQAK